MGSVSAKLSGSSGPEVTAAHGTESRWYLLLAFFVPLCVYLLSMGHTITADYSESILATQFAFWHYHSFSLGSPGQLIVQTVDKGLFKGRYYSVISPGFAVLSLPFAVLGFVLDGNAFTAFGYASLMDELFLSFAAALAVAFVYKICRLYAPPLPSALASFSLAFGTSVWPFATTIWIHDASLLFSVAATYLVLKNAREGAGPRSLAAAGVLLGISCFIEYFAIFLVLPLVGYLALSHVRRRDIALFPLGFLVGPLLHFSYNYAAFGNPLLFPEQLKLGLPGGLLSEFSLSDAAAHLDAYFASPYRGILFFAPVVLVGFYGLYKMEGPKLDLDCKLFVALFLVILIPYSTWQDWAGGLAYGPRFLILAMPYLCIPISVALASASRRGLASFVVLFVLSSFIEGAGALTSAYSVYGDWSTYQLLSFNLPSLVQGKLDVWWLSVPNWDVSEVSRTFVAALFLALWVGVTFLAIEYWRSKRADTT